MSLLHHHSSETTNQSSDTDVMASSVRTKPPASDTHTDDTDDYVMPEWEYSSRQRGFGVAAVLALLIAAWAAIVPFVGPTFNFSADGTSSWTWNEVHALGGLLPGAIGVLACVMLLGAVRQPGASGRARAFWGFTLVLCGAWLTVLPVAWPVLHSAYFHAASPTRVLEYWLAYASGPGVLLATFGAFVMGRSRQSRT
jgi:hypothetical protein